MELHNHLENRSSFFVFVFFQTFLQYNPQVLICLFLNVHVTFFFFFFDPLFALLYNEMVTVSKYIETKRVALLQNLQEYGTINCVLILSMRFVDLLLPCRVIYYYFFFIYIFQTSFI